MTATTEERPGGPHPTELSTLTLEMLLHDIAAPIRHLRFFFEEVTGSVDQPTAQQQAWALRIQDNLAAAESLLQDSRLLLTYHRQPLVTVDEPVRPNRLLRQIVRSFQADAATKAIRLSATLPENPLLHVHPQALRRIVTNLLTNAMRATPAGGEVHLATRLEDGRLLFAVRDTGVGLTTTQLEDLERRWEDFDRGANPRGVWGGLGLLICHSIVRRHGGRLAVASAGPDRGSTFSFALKVVPEPSVALVQNIPSSD